MSTPGNSFKAALAAGRRQIGLWQALADPYTAEICAGAGFDWLLFDAEHGPNDIRSMLAQLQATAPYPSHPVARPPVGEAHLVKQYLDIGFTTLLIPMVNTPVQAAELVRATRYPPAGVRGVGSAIGRASRWNRTPGYLAHADQGVCLIVQIETREGLKNLDAIAATQGVDALFIGPSDLCAALGHRGNPGHPEVQAAIEQGLRSILTHGKAAGVLASDQAMAHRYLEMGFLFVAVGTDVSILVRETTTLAREFGCGDPQEEPSSSLVY